jgi:hypothetical protein
MLHLARLRCCKDLLRCACKKGCTCMYTAAHRCCPLLLACEQFAAPGCCCLLPLAALLLPASSPGALFSMAVQPDKGSATLKLPGCVILNEGMPPKVASTPYTVLGAGRDCACISSCTTCAVEENRAIASYDGMLTNMNNERRCTNVGVQWCASAV